MTRPVDAWTVEEAARYFSEGPLPIEDWRLRLLIRGLREFSPAGRAPSGEKGGRGAYLYKISDLMELHSANARWL